MTADLERASKAQLLTYQYIAPTLTELSHRVFDYNLAKGWYTDLKTGKFQDPAEFHHLATKLALIHSEVSEALEAARKNLMDDKLPHRRGVEVELADAVIRILDVAGALGLDIGQAMYEKAIYNDQREDHKLEVRSAGGKLG